MKLVVSDASPVHYLVLIGAIDILPKLFSKVIIPEHVISQELQRPKTPLAVRDWAANLPAWVEVRKPLHSEPLRLHVGEAHAIALALELGAPVLLDEKEARQIAKDKGLIVIGTVGLIERAAELNLLNLTEAVAALRKTNARISKRLLDLALQRHSRGHWPSRRSPSRRHSDSGAMSCGPQSRLSQVPACKGLAAMEPLDAITTRDGGLSGVGRFMRVIRRRPFAPVIHGKNPNLDDHDEYVSIYHTLTIGLPHRLQRRSRISNESVHQ